MAYLDNYSGLLPAVHQATGSSKEYTTKGTWKRVVPSSYLLPGPVYQPLRLPWNDRKLRGARGVTGQRSPSSKAQLGPCLDDGLRKLSPGNSYVLPYQSSQMLRIRVGHIIAAMAWLCKVQCDETRLMARSGYVDSRDEIGPVEPSTQSQCVADRKPWFWYTNRSYKNS